MHGYIRFGQYFLHDFLHSLREIMRHMQRQFPVHRQGDKTRAILAQQGRKCLKVNERTCPPCGHRLQCIRDFRRGRRQLERGNLYLAKRRYFYGHR